MTLALFCSSLAIADPFIFEFEAWLPVRLLFWNANGAFMVAAWYGAFRLLISLRSRFGFDRAVPSAVIIVLSVAVLLHFNYWIAGVIVGDPDIWRGKLYWDIARYCAIALVFETAVATLLMPGMLKALRRQRAADRRTDPPEAVPEEIGEPECTELELNGRTFDPATVLYLKSVEHYVEVVLHDARELVRASLRDMIEKFDPGFGMQPHRSYWVTRAAIVGLNRENGGHFLVLSNGDEIPVSRHRRKEVTQWIRQDLSGGR